MTRDRGDSATIPLADAGALAARSRRFAALRILLATALALCLGVAVALAEPERRAETPLLTAGPTIVVLDISSSIGVATYRNVASALRRVAATRRTAGLVLFSSDAYEALPPGTPVAELRAYERFFDRRDTESLFTPWLQLSGGTRLTKGLQAARHALLRDGVRGGSVVLISDLVDTPSDRPRLEQALTAYRRDGITLKVLPLGSGGVRNVFERLAGRQVFVDLADLGPERPAAADAVTAGFPRDVALAGALLLALLALNELLCARLVWGRGRAEAAT